MKKRAFTICLAFFVCTVFGSAQASEITAEWIELFRTEAAFPVVDDEYYHVEDGVLYYNHILVAYPERKKDTAYTIIDGTEIIAESAFAYNDYLEKIIMPDSIFQIGESAFEGCSSLSNVVLSSKLLIIGGSAFSNCWSLETIALPPNLYAIAAHAFSETSKLRRITIPASVRYVGDEAFSRSGVRQIIFEGWIESMGICIVSPSSTFAIEIYVPSNEFYYVEKLQEEFDKSQNIRIICAE